MGKKNKLKQIAQVKPSEQKQSIGSVGDMIEEARNLVVPEELREENIVLSSEDIPGEVSAEELRNALKRAKEAFQAYEKGNIQNNEKKQQLESNFSELRQKQVELDKDRKDIEELKKEKQQGFRKEREKILEDAENIKQEILQRSEEMHQRQIELDEQKKKYEDSMESLENDKRLFEKHLQSAVAQKQEELDIEKLAYERRSEAMRKYVERFSETERDLLAAKDRIHQLEQQDNISFLEQRNAQLEEDNQSLRDELRQRPPADQGTKLEELSSLNQRLEDDCSSLSDENARLKAQNKRMRLDVMEIENLREEKELLETKCKIHQQAVEEIKKDLNNYLNQQQGTMVFPSCKEMDEERSLNKVVDLSEDPLDLSEFTQNLRNVFAKNYERYYTVEDIRCFIGGMAASKLIILQGLSGTGKTTLPRILSEAIGADSDEKCIIPIQAGWRDRSDLIGHYNSFDKKFYETKFLKALYRAHMPRYARKPYFIVLDEMNLSYAEQYFADFISLMEQESKKLELVTHAASANKNVWPKHLIIDEGISIDLPDNVWFVGTANHDETTMDFADKTYDRAHIMELPSTAQSFSVSASIRNCGLEELSFSSLNDAFENARMKYKSDADKALEKLKSHFRKLMNDKFGINWGNRLEKQTRSLLPVILACGGSVSEAMDHILSTKIIRKLKNRHDNTKEDLNALLDLVMKKPFGGEMVKSVEMIDHLLKNSL